MNRVNLVFDALSDLDAGILAAENGLSPASDVALSVVELPDGFSSSPSRLRSLSLPTCPLLRHFLYSIPAVISNPATAAIESPTPSPTEVPVFPGLCETTKYQFITTIKHIVSTHSKKYFIQNSD